MGVASVRRTARRVVGIAIAAALAGAVLVGLDGGQRSWALPPDGASTTDSSGTSSSVWPTTFTIGDVRAGTAVINFTVSGFGANDLVNIKIDDGEACTDTTHGACVYHQQRLDGNGSTTGSFTLPSDLSVGAHWLRMLGTKAIYENGQQVGYDPLTRRGGNDFTIVDGVATSSGTGQQRSSDDTTNAQGSGGTTGQSGATEGTHGGTADGGDSAQQSGGVADTETLTVQGDAAAQQPTTVSHDTAAPQVPVTGDYELISANSGGFRAEQDGTSVTVTLAGVPAGQSLYVFAFSEPTPLGWVDVSEETTVTIDVADLPAGDHKLAFVKPDATLAGWVSVTRDGGEAAGDAAAASSQLPIGGIVALGVAVLVAAGLIIWVLARKPRARAVGGRARDAGDTAGDQR